MPQDQRREKGFLVQMAANVRQPTRFYLDLIEAEHNLHKGLYQLVSFPAGQPGKA